MEDRGLKPGVITCNAAISACEKCGQWEKALELFNSMEGRGLKPGVITFSACIDALHTAAQFEEARFLMLKARSRDFFPLAWRSASKIDLHDCSSAVAQTILRLTLEELNSGARTPCDITVITGRGNRSGEGGAVLPDQVRSFLIEYGGPEITEVPRNPGCFLLTRDSVIKWASFTK